MKKKKCLDCKKEEFVVNPLARYERKYCIKCSAKRKKMWDEQWKVKFEDLSEE